MSPIQSRVRGWLRRPAVLLLLAFLVLASLVSLIGRLTSPDSGSRPAALTTDPGSENYAALSPDGKRVAYTARGRGADDRYHLFVKTPGGTALQLTKGPANDVAPAWSPDGSMLAFARIAAERVSYVLVPAGGGTERELGGFAWRSEDAVPPKLVCWAPDGKALLATWKQEQAPAFIGRLSPGEGPIQPLTSPPATSEGDFNPAISKDGATLAFTRRTSSQAEDLWVAPLRGGEARRLTFDEHLIRGVAWYGTELVYASSLLGDWRLYRISTGASAAKQIVGAGREAQFPTVSQSARRLAWTHAPNVSNIWRAPLPEGEPQALVASTSREFAARYSPDGRQIAFVSDRGGSEQIWVADADGANPSPVTKLASGHLMRPAWSPDSRSIVFDVRTEMRPETYVTSAERGKPAVPRILVQGAFMPTWSHDGRWIYYTGGPQIWRVAADGSNRRQITHRGGYGAIESPDSKYLYYYGHGRRGIWRIPVDGGEPQEAVVEPGARFLGPGLAVTATALYYLRADGGPREIDLCSYDFKTGKRETVRSLPNFAGERAPTFDVSPDGKYVIYPRADRSESDLMLLENFR